MASMPATVSVSEQARACEWKGVTASVMLLPEQAAYQREPGVDQLAARIKLQRLATGLDRGGVDGSATVSCCHHSS